MPGTPKQEKAETESDFGKGVLHMNTVEAGKTMYGANYCDFPAEIKKAPLKYPCGNGAPAIRTSHPSARRTPPQ